MRVWDVDPARLCRKHLLGEHREIHALFVILNEGRAGYRNHPETKRWVGKLPALKARHDLLVTEMLSRGYGHYSPLPDAHGSAEQDELLISIAEQKSLLTSKDCDCLLGGQPPHLEKHKNPVE